MCVSTGMTIRVHPFSHRGGVCLRQAWLNSGGLFREQDSEGITRANTRLRVRSRRQALRLSFCPEVWLVFQVQRLHHGLWADGKREELHHAGPASPGGAGPAVGTPRRRGHHPQGGWRALQVPGGQGGPGRGAADAGVRWGPRPSSFRTRSEPGLTTRDAESPYGTFISNADILTVASEATLLKGLPSQTACVKGGWEWVSLLQLRGQREACGLAFASCPGKQTRRSSSWATEEAPVPLRGPGVMEARPLVVTVLPRPDRCSEEKPGMLAPAAQAVSRGLLPRVVTFCPGEPVCAAGPRFCAFCRGRRCRLCVCPKSWEEGVFRSGEPRGRVPSELPTPGVQVLSPYLLTSSFSV